ncbi:uncharacterized protein [Apostichopus japonicus]|uniref:uncharacterized protein n=1 Tax=Stichopus japonicus TaxID=307972 RepID=UPI003AB49522
MITTETPSSSAESTEQGTLISSTSEGSSTKVEIETDASTNPTTTIVTLEEKTTESTSEVITSDVFSTGISASSEVTTQEHYTATESTVTESSTAATTFHSTTDGTISTFTNISQEVASSTKGIITTETPSSSAESTEQGTLISSTSEGSSTKVEIETDASTNPTTTIVTLEEKTTESTSEVITIDVFSTGISASSEVTTQEHSTATESTVTESSTAATTFHSTTDGTISPFINISKGVASSTKGMITTETPSSSAESTEQGTLISSTSEGSSTKVEIETDASTNPTTTIVTLEEKTTESTSEVITSDVFSTGISASSEVTTQEHSTATESTVTESSTAATTFHSTTDGTISTFTNISQEVASSTKGIITTETPSSSAESTEQGILISSTSEGSSTKVEIETDASTNPTKTIVTLEEKTTESTSEVITIDVFSTGISASSEVTTQEHSTATESTVTESSTAATTFHSTTDGKISPFTNISQEVASSTKGIITTETPSSSAESTEQGTLISSTSEGSSTKVEIETDASIEPATTVVTLEETGQCQVTLPNVHAYHISANSRVQREFYHPGETIYYDCINGYVLPERGIRKTECCGGKLTPDLLPECKECNLECGPRRRCDIVNGQPACVCDKGFWLDGECRETYHLKGFFIILLEDKLPAHLVSQCDVNGPDKLEKLINEIQRGIETAMRNHFLTSLIYIGNQVLQLREGSIHVDYLLTLKNDAVDASTVNQIIINETRANGILNTLPNTNLTIDIQSFSMNDTANLDWCGFHIDTCSVLATCQNDGYRYTCECINGTEDFSPDGSRGRDCRFVQKPAPFWKLVLAITLCAVFLPILLILICLFLLLACCKKTERSETYTPNDHPSVYLLNYKRQTTEEAKKDPEIPLFFEQDILDGEVAASVGSDTSSSSYNSEDDDRLQSLLEYLQRALPVDYHSTLSSAGSKESSTPECDHSSEEAAEVIPDNERPLRQRMSYYLPQEERRGRSSAAIPAGRREGIRQRPTKPTAHRTSRADHQGIDNLYYIYEDDYGRRPPPILEPADTDDIDIRIQERDVHGQGTIGPGLVEERIQRKPLDEKVRKVYCPHHKSSRSDCCLTYSLNDCASSSGQTDHNLKIPQTEL